jgi:hypothetical protein
MNGTFADTILYWIWLQEHKLHNKYVRNILPNPSYAPPSSANKTTPQLPYHQMTYIRNLPGTFIKHTPLTLITFQQPQLHFKYLDQENNYNNQ